MSSMHLIGYGAFGKALAHAATYVGTTVIPWRRGDTPVLSTSYLLCIPAQQVREVLTTYPWNPAQCILACKGIEASTGAFMSEVVKECFPDCRIGVLHGPNLAVEIREGIACGMTLAYETPLIKQQVQNWFCKDRTGSFQERGLFLWDTCRDVLGLQCLGALKNVAAIGCGLLRRQRTSENLLATYIASISKEIIGVMEEVGGKKETFFLFGGLGDLVLTCYSQASRNHQYGYHFPKTAENTVEGMHSINGLYRRFHSLKGYPILETLRAILNHSHKPETLLRSLLQKNTSLMEQ